MKINQQELKKKGFINFKTMKSFSYKDNKLYCEKVSLEKVVQKISTPFYLYSSKQILDNFNSLAEKLKGYNVLIAYAVKANSNISILKLLAKKGAGADVVSYGELIRAIKSGIPGKKIVFSGVGKTDLEISRAIDHNILQFNIESYEELLTIEKIAREKRSKANISIRINPDIDAGGHPKISTGKKTDKFGISISEALKVYKEASNYTCLNIVGVDMHIGSLILQIKPFEKSTGNEYVLAAAIHIGEEKSTEFKEAEKEGGSSNQLPGSRAINVVVVADVDVLAGVFFLLRERASFFDERFAKWQVDNVPFVLNVLDDLAGDSRFIDIRKRRPMHRELMSIKRLGDKAKEDRDHARQTAQKKFKTILYRAIYSGSYN